MAKVDFRGEVLNVALAELLEQRGIVSVPETIRKSIARKPRDLPDILLGEGRLYNEQIPVDAWLRGLVQ
jgi:hypothetical protein